MAERTAPTRPWVGAWLALAAFAAFRLPSLVRYPPWTDEVWTMAQVDHPLFGVLRLQADDQVQPPLFYALLWLWRAVGGDALWWLRLLPCLIGICIALPVLAICRRARLTSEATALALALVAASQSLIFYSNELRSYALYALFAAWSLALWLRARESGSRRDVALLTVVNICLVYTHYFGWLVVAAEWLDALVAVRGRLRAITASGFVTALARAPGVAIVVHFAVRSGDTLGSAGWIQRPHLSDVFDPYRWALGGSPSLAIDLLLLVAIGGAIALLVVRRRRTLPGVVTLAFAASVPSACAIAVSLLQPRSVWVPRYLLAVAAPFLVLASAAVVDLLPPRTRRFAVVLAGWPAALSIAAAADGREKVHFDVLANGIVAASPRSGADVFVFDWIEGGPLTYQAARAGGAFRVRYAAAVDSITSASGWLLWSEHHPPYGLPPAAALLRRGYRVGAPLAVTGMWDDQVGRTDSVIALPFHRGLP
jgi:hypothetical protein